MSMTGTKGGRLARYGLGLAMALCVMWAARATAWAQGIDMTATSINGRDAIEWVQVGATTRVAMVNSWVIAEIIGGQFSWDAPAATAVFTGRHVNGANVEVRLPWAATSGTINGLTYDIATYSGVAAPGTVSSYTSPSRDLYVPLHFVARAFGFTVTWDEPRNNFIVQGGMSGVTIHPPAISLPPGAVRQFTATVTGPGNPSQAVTWSLAGNPLSGINNAGVLTVHPNETAFTLTVIARSVADNTKFASALVTVLTPANQTYHLSVTADYGGRVTSGSGYYTAGTPVYITARPDGGYTFDAWDASGGRLYNADKMEATLIMPPYPATVTAYFYETAPVSVPPVVPAPPMAAPSVSDTDPDTDPPPYELAPPPATAPVFTPDYPPLALTALNGTRVNLSQPPLFIDGSTYIPVREIFQRLGFSAVWDADAREATLTKGNTVVLITEGSRYFMKNGAAFTSAAPARRVDGILMIPFDEILESVGARAHRDEQNRLFIYYSL